MRRSHRWITFVVLLAFAWTFRPFIHPLVMSFYVSPLRIILILLLFGGIIFAFRRVWPMRLVQSGVGQVSIKTARGLSSRTIFIYFFVLMAIMVSLFFESEIRLLLTSRQVSYEARTTLPDFSPIRLTPKDVATRYAEDSFQSPQEKLGDSQIVLVDGKLKRVFPRIPDGLILYLTRKLNGFVTVDVDTLTRKVDIVDQQFQVAEGIGIFDNIHYRLPLKKYFVNYSNEPIYLKDNKGEWVTVVPYVTYRGFLIRTPQWGGVMIVRSDGSVEDLSPEAAQALPYLKGNRLYPKELTEFYADSYAYRGGLINKWFLHKNQTEVVHLPNGEEVLHVATTEGYKQMIVAEPYGRAYGIFKIFFFDATTGKPEIIEYDQHSQLTGPIVATDYIKKEFPTYDWSAFILAEPRPVTINGTLHWLLSIIPADSAGIAGTVVMNSKTNEVTQAKTEAELQALIRGEKVESTTTVTTDPKAEIKAKIEAIEKELGDLKKLVE